MWKCTRHEIIVLGALAFNNTVAVEQKKYPSFSSSSQFNSESTIPPIFLRKEETLKNIVANCSPTMINWMAFKYTLLTPLSSLFENIDIILFHFKAHNPIIESNHSTITSYIFKGHKKYCRMMDMMTWFCRGGGEKKNAKIVIMKSEREKKKSFFHRKKKKLVFND